MDRRALFGLAAAALAPTVARASSGGGGSASAESYIRLPTVTASIVQGDGRRGVLSIEIGVDVPDPANRARTQQSLPRLRAAFNTAAQQFAARLRPGWPPDIDQLASALQGAADGALGRSGARVLLGTVMAL